MEMKQKTPKEAKSKRKPLVNNLKVFGSIAYAWLPYERIPKLETKSRKSMLPRYDNNHKSYRLIDVGTNQVTFSRDVMVD